MTVSELIDKLKKCEPTAEVACVGMHGNYLDEGMHVPFKRGL